MATMEHVLASLTPYLRPRPLVRQTVKTFSTFHRLLEVLIQLHQQIEMLFNRRLVEQLHHVIENIVYDLNPKNIKR